MPSRRRSSSAAPDLPAMRSPPAQPQPRSNAAPILPPMATHNETTHSADQALFFIDSVGTRDQPHASAAAPAATDTTADTNAPALVPQTKQTHSAQSSQAPAVAPSGTEVRNSVQHDVIDVSMDEDEPPPLERVPSHFSPVQVRAKEETTHAPVPIRAPEPSAPVAVTPVVAAPMVAAAPSTSVAHSIRHALTGNALAKTHMQHKAATAPVASPSSSSPFLALTSSQLTGMLRSHPYLPPTMRQPSQPAAAAHTPSRQQQPPQQPKQPLLQHPLLPHPNLSHLQQQQPQPQQPLLQHPLTRPQQQRSQPSPQAAPVPVAAAVSAAVQPLPPAVVVPSATTLSVAPTVAQDEASRPSGIKPHHLPQYDHIAQLTAPTVWNPLGLVALQPGEILYDFVLIEVLTRWLRMAYTPQHSMYAHARHRMAAPEEPILFDTLKMHFSFDTLAWAKVDDIRLMDNFAVAWYKAHPSTVGKKVIMPVRFRDLERDPTDPKQPPAMQSSITVAATRRPYITSSVTMRFATPEELEASIADHAKREASKKRKHVAVDASTNGTTATDTDTAMVVDTAAADASASAPAPTPSPPISASKLRRQKARAARVAVPNVVSTPMAAAAPVVTSEPMAVDDLAEGEEDAAATLALKQSELKRLQKRMSNKEQNMLNLKAEIMIKQAEVLKKEGKMEELRERVNELKEWIAADKTRKQNPAAVPTPAATSAATKTPSVAPVVADEPMPAAAPVAAPLVVAPTVSPNPPSVSSSPESALPSTIRLGLPSDAAALCAFLRQAFIDAYAKFNTPADMEIYMTNSYSEAIQREELSSQTQTVFLAERDGQIVGAAMTNSGDPAPSCVTDRTALNIQRVYGIGVGSHLMRRCVAHALWLGLRHTWIGVWEHNPRAIAFYKKHKYTECGKTEFVLGTSVQTDRVMHLRLEEEQRHDPLAISAPLPNYRPLWSSHSLRERVLHAVQNAPHHELELEFGCSLLQIAMALRVPVRTIEPIIVDLVDKGECTPTRDFQQTYKATTKATDKQ